jgi:hypothetical protein
MNGHHEATTGAIVNIALGLKMACDRNEFGGPEQEPEAEVGERDG